MYTLLYQFVWNMPVQMMVTILIPGGGEIVNHINYPINRRLLRGSHSGTVAAPHSDLYIAANVSAFKSHGGAGFLVVGPLILNPSPMNLTASPQRRYPLAGGGGMRHEAERDSPPLPQSSLAAAMKDEPGGASMGAVWLIGEEGRIVDKANA